jgi:hypothetical protein
MINPAATGNQDRAHTPVEARAIFADGRSVIHCRIKNFSITGARLALDEATVLPDQFLLEVPARKKTYRAELRWKSRDAAGVKFLNEVAGQAPAVGLEELRSEIAVLRHQNAKMAARLATLGFSEWLLQEDSSVTSPQGLVGH